MPISQEGEPRIARAPRLYLLAGFVAAALAAFSLVLFVFSHSGYGLVVGVIWAVISALAFRSARREPA